jgi:ribulose-5-phosphate 4-epimerase/fuculose-1-phosphate aldolase
MLAAAFRLFSRFGFDEGVAGHITARDPEQTVASLAQPFDALYFIDTDEASELDLRGRLSHPSENPASAWLSEANQKIPSGNRGLSL